LKSAIFSPFIYNDLNVALTSGYIDVLPDGYLIRTWLHIDPAGLGFVEDQDGNTILSFDIVVMTSNVNDFAHIQAYGVVNSRFQRKMYPGSKNMA